MTIYDWLAISRRSTPPVYSVWERGDWREKQGKQIKVVCE